MTSNASAAGEEQGSVSEIPVTPIGVTQSTIDVAEAAQEHPQHQERENAEEALESHEVIELQAFIERKEWIEEKIKVRL